MDTHQLITYLMENVIKYRSRIPAAVQDGSLSLLLINALKIPHLIKQNLEFVKRKCYNQFGGKLFMGIKNTVSQDLKSWQLDFYEALTLI